MENLQPRYGRKLELHLSSHLTCPQIAMVLTRLHGTQERRGEWQMACEQGMRDSENPMRLLDRPKIWRRLAKFAPLAN